MKNKKYFWVKFPFDEEDPCCVKCGVLLNLIDGCDFDEISEFNLCYNCALDILHKLVE